MDAPAPANQFHIADYVIFSSIILMSMGIGLYYAFTGDRQRTLSEYLMGNHNMKVLPIALSLIVSYESSIMMLGVPAEIYVYGSMYFMTQFGFLFIAIVSTILFVPVLQPLKLTCLYEYFGLRFNSLVVRKIGAILGMISEIWYLGIVLYGPGIALEAVTGISFSTSTLVVAGTSVFYTCLGGFKAVIWTDVLQSVIMYIGMIAVIIKATMHVGGISDVFEIASNNQRLNFFEFNPDPTIRHTFWSLVVGSAFRWMQFIFRQATIQRLCSTPTIKTGRQVMVIGLIGFIIMNTLACLQGVVAYAYFYTERCDPLESGTLSNPNQIMPYMVMKVFKNIPGLLGLYIAALFSACLSTLSSGFNSLSAITVVEFVKPWGKDLTDFKETLIAKAIVLVSGILAVGTAYLIGHIGATLNQISASLLGSSNGPVFGLFLLGMFFSWTNWKGAIAGAVTSYAISLWIALGSSFSENKVVTPWLPPAPTDQCFIGNISNATEWENETVTWNTTIETDVEPQGLDKLYTLSYMWIPAVGVVISVLVGMVTSLISGKSKEFEVDPRLMVSLPECGLGVLRNKQMEISSAESNEGINLKEIKSMRNETGIAEDDPMLENELRIITK